MPILQRRVDPTGIAAYQNDIAWVLTTQHATAGSELCVVKQENYYLCVFCFYYFRKLLFMCILFLLLLLVLHSLTMFVSIYKNVYRVML